MRDTLVAEAILCQIVFSREERELRLGEKGQKPSRLLTSRTIAREHLLDILHLHLKPHHPTLTPTRIFFHRFFLLELYKEFSRPFIIVPSYSPENAR